MSPLQAAIDNVNVRNMVVQSKTNQLFGLGGNEPKKILLGDKLPLNKYAGIKMYAPDQMK